MARVTIPWTYPAVAAGTKTCARLPLPARRLRGLAEGALLVVFDRDRRRAGRPVAVVRLTCAPCEEELGAMEDADYDREGWRWLHEHRALLSGPARGSDYSWEAFGRWRAHPGRVLVIRFELVAVVEDQISEAMAAASA
jgi:hypothetical protein